MIRLVIISDTHGLHHGLKKFGELPDGDILIHGGDVSNIGEIHDINRFLSWFGGKNFDQKIFIAGNHDFGFERDRYIINAMMDDNIKNNITYLEDTDATIEGLKFWGSPITSPFMNWAFMMGDNHRAKLWEIIPNDTDILITHGPPHDILDFSLYGSEHCGCKFLRSKVLDIKPIVHIFGHIHGEYGIHEENGILFINASTLNYRYDITNKPVVVDVDVENRLATVVS